MLTYYDHSSFAPSASQINVICVYLHHRFISHLEEHSVQLATFDEQTIGYQPSHIAKKKADDAGEPIPIYFIPRKPHPNCMVIYQVHILYIYN